MEPTSPAPRRGPRAVGVAAIVLGLAFVVAILAATAALLLQAPSTTPVVTPPDASSGTSADPYVELRAELRELLESGALATAPIERTFDDEAALREVARYDAAAYDAAVAGHTPFVRADGESLHAFHERFLRRSLRNRPAAAISFGVHPHPHGVNANDERRRATSLLLARDVYRALRDWQAEPPLTSHEATDREIVLGALEVTLRWQPRRDTEILLGFSGSLDPLVYLSLIECCPDEDRAAAALARLQALPALWKRRVGALKRPSPTQIALAVKELASARAELVAYADGFTDLEDAQREALDDAARRAGQALDETRASLFALGGAAKWEPPGMGLGNFALLLSVKHHLDITPEDLFADALAEMDTLCAGMERADSAHVMFRELSPGPSYAESAADLGARAATWVEPVPADPGLRTAPIPGLWADGFASAYHLRPGPLLDNQEAVMLVGAFDVDGDGLETTFDHASRFHLVAHEASPGHHLEHAGSLASCLLRRSYGDGVFIEGWARYAEDLVHAAEGCPGGAADALLRRADDLNDAWGAAFEVAIHSNALPEWRLRALLAEWRRTDVEPADLGSLFAASGRLCTYFLGHREMNALRASVQARRGASFDGRAFHGEVIRSGAPPVPLLAEELR